MENLSQSTLELIAFSKNERRLFGALSDEPRNPASLVESTGIPRASLYLAFEQLQMRGLARIKKVNHKRYWVRDTADQLKNAAQELAKLAGSKLETVAPEKSYSESVYIKIHEGKASIIDLLTNLTKSIKVGPILKFQSDNTHTGWLKTFSKDEIMRLNSVSKMNGVIEHRIIPHEYFRNAVSVLGNDWKESFTNITSSTVLVDKKYMDSLAEVWTFYDTSLVLYLEKHLVVEIRNKDITNMFRGLLTFVYEHSELMRKA